MEQVFSHKRNEQRFELLINNQDVAFISYEVHNGKLYLDHTIVPEQLSGQGIGKILATKAFAAIQAEGLAAVATCSYLVALIKRNPEWQFIEI